MSVTCPGETVIEKFSTPPLDLAELYSIVVLALLATAADRAELGRSLSWQR